MAERLRMPAEWEPHAGTWLAWPHALTTWPGCLEEAEREFEFFVRTLATFERVELLVQSTEHRARIASRLGALAGGLGAPVGGLGALAGEARVRLHVMPTDDVWMRDIGPTFVRGPAGLVALDWKFNAWGGKYPPWDRDDAVAEQVAKQLGVACERPGIVLEGGAIEVDGQGTLLATEPTLLDPKRNPGIDKAAIAALALDLLGVRTTIWLGAGPGVRFLL